MSRVHPEDVVTIGKTGELDEGEGDALTPKVGDKAALPTNKTSCSSRATSWLSEKLDLILPQKPENVRKLRKGVRVETTVGIFFFVIFMSTNLFYHRSTSEPRFINENSPLYFEINRCQLRFRCHDPGELDNPDNSFRTPPKGKIWVDHYMPLPGNVPFKPDNFWEEIAPNGNANESVWTFKINNDFSDGVIDYCHVNVEVNFGAVLGPITVKCTESCVVVMDSSDVDDSMTGDTWHAWSAGEMEIDASAVSSASTVRLSNARMQSLNVTMAQGDVFLEDIVIREGSSVVTYLGDVYAQIRQDMKVRWNASTSYYCLAAPVEPAPLLAGSCNNTNLSQSNSSCSGFVHLCGNETNCFKGLNSSDFEDLLADPDLSDSLKDTLTKLKAEKEAEASWTFGGRRMQDDGEGRQLQEESEGFFERPELDLSVPEGSFYVTRTESNSEGDLAALIPHRGAGFADESITFTQETQMQLEEANKVLSNTATSGRVFVFTGPPNAQIARPGTSFLFSLLPSKAYAALKPWWLSWFCFLLLNDQQVYQETIQMKTGPCPYTSVISEASLSRVSHEIEQVASSGGSNVVVYVSNVAYPLGSRAFRYDPPGTNRFTRNFPVIAAQEDMRLLNHSAFESSEIVNLDGNIPLMLALIISVCIGFIIATVALYFFWRGLSVYVHTAIMSSKQLNRYSELDAEQALDKEVFDEPAATDGQTLAKDLDDDGIDLDSEAEEKAPASTRCVLNAGFQLIKDNAAKISLPKEGTIFEQQEEEDEGGEPKKKEEPQRFDALTVALGKVKMISFYDLPPIFGMIEHFAVQIQKKITDSLDNFLTTRINEDHFIKNNASQPYWPGVPLADFKNVYSKYCFLTGLSECTSRAKREATFERHGFKLVELPVEEQSDGFVRIRFKTQRELEWEMSRGRPRQQVGESSLDFFLRASCKQTRFDSDSIDVDDFKSQYTLFCEQYRIQDVVTVSKALLQQRKGISSTKLASVRIVPKFSAGDPKSVKLDMAMITKHVETMCSQHDGVDMAANVKIKGWRWIVIDVCASSAHTLWILITALYINVWGMFLSNYYSLYSTADLELTWQFVDLVTSPARLLNIPFAYPLWFLWFTIPYLFMIPAQYTELLLYYYQQPLPLDSLRYFAVMRMASHDISIKNFKKLFSKQACKQGFWWKHTLKILRFALHCYQWFQLLWMIYLSIFFLSMVAVWIILAALINPENFLAYSTAVGTLITFVSGKYTTLQKLFRNSLDDILDMLEAFIQEKINLAIQKMCEVTTAYLQDAGGKALDAVADTVGDVVGQKAKEQFEQHVMTLAGSPLGRNITSAGFDIDLVVRLSSGDLSALEEFAEENGIPTELVDIMIGLAQGNAETVVKAIGGLLSKYQNASPIAPELAISLAELALHPSRPKAEKVTKALFQYGLPAMLKLWTSELGGAAPKPLLEAEARINDLINEVQRLQKEFPDLPIDKIMEAMQMDEAKREDALQQAVTLTLDPAARERLLNEFRDLAQDPQLRQMAWEKLQQLTSRESLELIGGVIGDKIGLSPRTREAATNLLLDVLPPFLKGLVSLVKRDYHEFVTSLVYVHDSLSDQKPFLVARFGALAFQNFERIRPILNMLDILMRTGSVQDSIFAILEDSHVLSLPPEVITFTKFLLWLRAPTSRQDIIKAAKNPMQIKFLCSWSERKRAIKDAADFFNLNADLGILVEVLVAVALEDIRALTFDDVGKRLAKCAMVLLEKSPLQLLKGAVGQELLADLFDMAMTLLVALQAGTEGDMFASLQDRTGIESKKMAEVVQLFLHRTSIGSPPHMNEWILLQAAANYVGLETNEAVGLAHLCFGHTESSETSIFLRELLRRQGVNPFGLDRFLKNLLAVEFKVNDQSVMSALQELNVRHRFTSMIGLHLAPPRYFSEDMLKAVGITDPEVLSARHAVPFRYEDGPAIWKEWIAKASLNIQAKPLGEWQYIDLRKIKKHTGIEGETRVETSEVHGARARASLITDPTELEKELSATLKGSSPLGLENNSERPSILDRSFSVPSSELQKAVPPEARAADAKLMGLKGAEGAKARQAKRREAAKQKAEEAEMLRKKKTQALKDLPDALRNPSAYQEKQRVSEVSQMMGLEEEEEEEVATPHKLTSEHVHKSPTLRAHRIEEVSFKDRFQVLQLNWLNVGMNAGILRFIIDYHNQRLRHVIANMPGLDITRETTNLQRIVSDNYFVTTAFGAAKSSITSMAQSGAKMAQSTAGAVEGSVDYQKSIAQRQLLNVQETSTGIVEQVKLQGPDALEIMLKILDLRRVVGGKASQESSGKGKRGIAVQNIADMLGVDTSRLSIFFDLMTPERTQDARKAVEAIGKQFLPEHETKAIAEAAYTIKRAMAVFDDIRTKLWDFAHRFHLPRFLASAALLPNLSYPPQIREVGSIAHFFFTPILMDAGLCSRAQIVLINLMGLASGSPPNSNLLAEVFGFSSEKNSLAVNLVRFMMRKSMTDKLQLVPQVMQMFLRRIGTFYPKLKETFNDICPFMLFFCGFPFAELPLDMTDAKSPGRGNVFTIIEERTGISKFVLQGIDLSQWSISPFSSSDENSFDYKSVLGLLLPMFNVARVSFQMKDTIPTDGIVKAIVSLAHCRTENLEYLAEALHLSTFLVQLLLQLVDLSRNTDNPARVQQVLQSIRMSAGITKQLTSLGIHLEKFLVLLSMSFPNMEDIAALQGYLDKLGLTRLGVDRCLVEFFYAAAICGLSHLRNVHDTTVHERNTTSLSKTMESIIDHLGFHHAMVPLTAIRLFQGYFNIFERDDPMMKMLLPSKLDRDAAMGVTGVLSYEPPEFFYHPACASGLLRVTLQHGAVEVNVKTETHLPPATPEFVFWIYDSDGNRIDLDEFDISVPSFFMLEFNLSVSRRAHEHDHELEQLNIWWRAFTHVEDSWNWKEERRHVARDGVRALEKSCGALNRTHWGGVAAHWWFKFDVHPLFLLLAEGDVSAVRLAADMLGVPDVLLAFLLSHVSMAPAEHLRPLLLSDLSIEGIIKRMIHQSVEDEDRLYNMEDDILMNQDFTSLLLGEPNLSSSDFEASADAPPRKCGLGYAGERKKDAPTNRALFGDTFTEGLSKIFAFGNSSSNVPGNAPVKISDGNTPKNKLPKGPQKTAAEKPSNNDSDSDDEDDNEDELGGSEVDPEEGDEAHDDMSDGAFEEDVGDEPPLAGCMHLTDPRHLISWTYEASMDIFPDELGELYNKGEGVETMKMARMLGSERSKNKDSIYESIAIDLLEEFRVYTENPCPKDELHPLKRWFYRWRHVPNNLHFLLSLLLAQLYGLLDQSGQTKSLNTLVTKAPTVSLMICLSKLSQARKEAAKLVHSKGRVIPAPQLQAYLMPAMWGFEVQIRRGREKFRRELKQDIRHFGQTATITGVHEDDDSFMWTKGGVFNFDIPVELCQRLVPGMDRMPTTSEDWLWEKWGWPCDHVTRMCCRVAQVSRLALGLASPISCWHPLDEQYRLHLAMKSKSGDRFWHEDPQLKKQLQRRGWDTLDSKILDDGLATDRDLNKRAHGRKLLSLSEKELKEDLLSASALSVLWSLVAGAANPDFESYSYKKVTFQTKAISQYAHIYSAVASLIATDFGSQKVHDSLMSATGQAFRVILRPELKLGARRISVWSQTICAEIGLDSQTLEALVQIAHGFVQTEKGVLIERGSFEALAARLRMPKQSGVPILQSICTKGWDYASSRVLAERLHLPTQVLHALIEASRGSVQGWIQLHNELFRQPSNQKGTQEEEERMDWEARMLTACMEFSNMHKNKRLGSTSQQWEWLSTLLDSLLPILTESVYDHGFPRKAFGSPTKIWEEWRSNQHKVAMSTPGKTISSLYSKGKNGTKSGKAIVNVHAIHTSVNVDVAGGVSGLAEEGAKQFGKVKDSALGGVNLVSKGIGQVADGIGDGINQIGTFTPKWKKDEEEDHEGKDKVLLKVTMAFVLHVLSGQNSAAAQLIASNEDLWESAGLTKEQATYFRDFSYLINHTGKVTTKDINDKMVENLAKPLTNFIRKVSGHSEPGDADYWACADCNFKNKLSQETCEACGSTEKKTKEPDVLQRRMVGLLNCLFGMITSDNKKVLKSIRRVMVDSVMQVLKDHQDVILEQGKIAKTTRSGDVRLRNLAVLKVRPEIVKLMVEHSSMRALIMVQSLKAFTRLREDRTAAKKQMNNKSQAYSLTAMARALHKEYASSFVKSIRNLWQKALKFGIMGKERLDRVKFRELFEDEDILEVMKHLDVPVTSVEEVLDMFDPGDGTFNVRDMLEGLTKLRDRKEAKPALLVAGVHLNPTALSILEQADLKPLKEEEEIPFDYTPRKVALAIGDKVVAKWPENRGHLDDPWFAGRVTDLHAIAKTCSVEYESGDFSSGIKEHEVYYAPNRDKDWGTGEMRGNNLLPNGAVAVTLESVRPTTGATSTNPQVATASSHSLEDVVVGSLSEADSAGTSPSAVPPLVGLQTLPVPPPAHSPPSDRVQAWPASGKRRPSFQPPPALTGDKKEKQAFNAMMHLFIGLATSDCGGFQTPSAKEMVKFIGELEKSFLPLLAGAATGRWEQVLIQLKELTVSLLEKADPNLADDVQLVLDLLTLIGMDKELVHKLLPVEGGETGGKFLEVFIRRITRFACEKLLNVEARNELVEIVDQLVRLLVVLSVDAPPAEIMARLQALITPLEKFLLNLLANDKRLVHAAEKLLRTVYAIAQDAPETKASEYVDLFSPGKLCEDGTREEAKAIVILKALKDLLLPFMPNEVHQPLLDVLRILSELSQLSADPTPLGFASRTPTIIEKLATVLCIPKHNVSGIIALAKGDWAGAADLCRPFCNIDPEILDQMSQILPLVRKTISSAKDNFTSGEEMAELNQGSDTHLATRVRQIAADAAHNKCGAKELFELVDIDRNGTITIEEFELMMKRLGFDLNRHRVLEILSACKKAVSQVSGGAISGPDIEDGLTAEEFEGALKYLQKSVALSSMQQLLVSQPRLMAYLAIFTLILFLTMLFIFLGVNAFVTGGVFSAIINSMMTLIAGISMSFAKAGQGEKNAKDPTTFRLQLKEVTSMVFGNS